MSSTNSCLKPFYFFSAKYLERFPGFLYTHVDVRPKGVQNINGAHYPDYKKIWNPLVNLLKVITSSWVIVTFEVIGVILLPDFPSVWFNVVIRLSFGQETMISPDLIWIMKIILSWHWKNICLTCFYLLSFEFSKHKLGQSTLIWITKMILWSWDTFIFKIFL